MFTNKDLWSIVDLRPLLIAGLLMFVNWGLETFKWKYLLHKQHELSFFRAFGIVFTGITIGLITPNRIGEVPGRVWLLADNSNKSKSIALTAVGAYTQLLVTFVIGTIASWKLLNYFVNDSMSLYINIALTLTSLLLFFLYIKSESVIRLIGRISLLKSKKLIAGISSLNLETLFITYLLSALRYIVFWVQFYLVLDGFGIPLMGFRELLLIPFCFMVASFIPNILISELLVRGSVALLIFGIVSDLDAHIILASVALWAINVAIPAVLGIPGLRKLKIVGN